MTCPIRTRLGPAALPMTLVLALAGCDRLTKDQAIPVTPVATAAGGASPVESSTPAAKKTALEGDRQAGLAEITPRPAAPQGPSPFRFAEIAQAAGIDFVHFSGMTSQKHFPTANGSGVAFFDYDNDGKLDVYFATATLLPPGTAT